MRGIIALTFSALTICGACAPPEYRALLGDTDTPVRETPPILPLSGLLPPEDELPPEELVADDNAALEGRSSALQARAAALAPAPAEPTDTADRARALRARAAEMRQHP